MSERNSHADIPQCCRESSCCFAAFHCLWVLVMVLSGSAFGDGMMYHEQEKPDPNAQGRWALLPEDQQHCVITYKDGREHMSLAVAPGTWPQAAGRALWLFPVPGTPDKIQIGIERSMPDWGGQEILAPARQRVDEMACILGVMQSPVAFSAYYAIREISKGLAAMGGAVVGDQSEESDSFISKSASVHVHQHVEDMGVTMELVTADHASALAQYAEIKKLSLPREAIRVLERYMDGKHAFVLTWISDPAMLGRMAVRKTAVQEYSRHRFIDDGDDDDVMVSPNVSAESLPVVSAAVSFPSERLYYPLMPTSVYGTRVVPASIKVEGFVTPRPGAGYAKYVKMTYWYHDGSRQKHTRIEISAPSDTFTEDLWMDIRPPLKAVLGFSIQQLSSVALYSILVLLLSMVASAVAASVVYRGQQPSLLKFALFGAANVLTFTGLSFLAVGTQIDRRYLGALAALPPLAPSGTCTERKFVLRLTEITLVLAGVVALIGTRGTADAGVFVQRFGLMFGGAFLALWLLLALQFAPFVWAKCRDPRLLAYLGVFLVVFLGLDGMMWLGLHLALR